MRLLILTSPGFYEFVSSTTSGFERGNEIYIFSSEDSFGFEYKERDFYDVGISFMYRYRVPKSELNVPWFNFHPAPLPEYKGRDLCYHAIMNGEKEFGATLHYMDEGFDTGDIIDVIRFPVGEHWVATDISAFAIEYSKRLFEIYLPKIIETHVFPRTPNVGGTYYKKGQIIEEIPVKPDSHFGQFVRAVTYKNFYPKIDIGGVKYKIVREE